jgi:hypothetical protein
LCSNSEWRASSVLACGLGARTATLHHLLPVGISQQPRVTHLSLPPPSSLQRDQAGKLLAQLQEHPQAWSRVDQILEQSKSQSTKFFALAILEKVIQYRWKVLPRQQCDGIRNYIVNLIIKLSSDETTLQKERLFLKKLNITLVQVRNAGLCRFIVAQL